MALLTKSSRAGFDTVSAQHAQQLSGELIAWEVITVLQPCYINADGRVHLCSAVTASPAAFIDGWSAGNYAVGDQVTLLGKGVIAKFSDGGLTPGAVIYLGGGIGNLSDTPT